MNKITAATRSFNQEFRLHRQENPFNIANVRVNRRSGVTVEKFIQADQ